jgi:hypothetical protein
VKGECLGRNRVFVTPRGHALTAECGAYSSCQWSPFKADLRPICTAAPTSHAPAQRVFCYLFGASMHTHTHTEQRVSKNCLMPSGVVISSLACISQSASASISFLARNIVGLRNIERASFIHFRLLVCIG